MLYARFVATSRRVIGTRSFALPGPHGTSRRTVGDRALNRGQVSREDLRENYLRMLEKCKCEWSTYCGHVSTRRSRVTCVRVFACVCVCVLSSRAKGAAHALGAFDISIGHVRLRDLDMARMPSELLARGSIVLPARVTTHRYASSLRRNRDGIRQKFWETHMLWLRLQRQCDKIRHRMAGRQTLEHTCPNTWISNISAIIAFVCCLRCILEKYWTFVDYNFIVFFGKQKIGRK